MSTRTYANSLSVDEASRIVAWLLLESLAHTTLRINKTFRDATRNHIKRNVLPILAPLRGRFWVVAESNFHRMDFQYREALTHYKEEILKYCYGGGRCIDDLSKALALGAFTNVESLWLDGCIFDHSALDLAKACGKEGVLSSLRFLYIGVFHGDAGMDAFAKCITKGGMPSLRGLVTCGRKKTFSKVSLRSACTSRGISLFLKDEEEEEEEEDEMI